MTLRSIGFFLGIFIFQQTSIAKSIELKKDGKTIFIKNESKWTIGKDLFGMPFILFSPKENGQQSNISFTDTGARLTLDFEALKENQDSFKKNKDEWAEAIGAQINGLNPYETNINKNGHRVHKIGITYTFKQKKYYENTYFLECRGRLIFSKSLRLIENQKHEKDFQEMIENLDCGGI